MMETVLVIYKTNEIYRCNVLHYFRVMFGQNANVRNTLLIVDFHKTV